MRLKHVKGAHERIEASNYIIHNPEKERGNYQNLFPNANPIYIEIGTGKGNFIVEKAKRNPNINFIGIEKFDSVMVKVVEKVEQEKLSNLLLIRMDATEIEKIFDHEIDLLYLNFSDPWPKKRHAHRRLTSPIFLKRYEAIFKGPMKLEMKTDNRHLFEYSLISFNEFGFKFDEISLNLHQDDIEDNVETEYEKKFSSMGFPIYKIHVTKEI